MCVYCASTIKHGITHSTLIKQMTPDGLAWSDGQVCMELHTTLPLPCFKQQPSLKQWKRTQYWRQVGTRIAQSVECWACCPVWCSIVGSILLRASSRGFFFSLDLIWVLTPFPKNSFGWEYKQRFKLCTHAFHHTNSKDPDEYRQQKHPAYGGPE